MRLCLRVLEALAARRLEQRQFGVAIATAYAALRMDPLRESAARTLVEIHLVEGNRAPAVRSYLEFRERSLTELDVVSGRPLNVRFPNLAREARDD